MSLHKVGLYIESNSTGSSFPADSACQARSLGCLLCDSGRRMVAKMAGMMAATGDQEGRPLPKSRKGMELRLIDQG